MNHYNNVVVNPIDPNPAISARKNSRFFHIFPNFPKENLPENIYQIKADEILYFNAVRIRFQA